MNGRQLQTLLWLRWRLTLNLIRRASSTRSVITTIVLTLLVLAACSSFATALVAGSYLLPRANSETILVLWNVAAVAFFFFWMTGVVTDLQRSDAQSLRPFLHLPVSPSGAFVLNFIGSWLSLTSLFFLPTLLALAAASVWTRGPRMIWLTPLLLGYFLLISSATHQLRGWLATLMSNPRRRRTVLAVVLGVFILLAQLPNLVNLWFFQGRSSGGDPLQAALVAEQQELLERTETATLRPEQVRQEQEAISARYQRKRLERRRQRLELVRSYVLTADAALPLGWLPYGVWSLEKHRYLPAAACLAALIGLSVWCLRRSYQTTIRFYMGDFDHEGPAKRPTPTDVRQRTPLVQRRLLGLSEQASAVAVTSLQSLLRATEFRLMLLTPVILLLIFGSLAARGSSDLPAEAHPLMALGAVGVAVLSVFQVSQNQFGYDRQGFRAWMLAPLDRKDLLLGKNVLMWLIGGAFGLGGLLVGSFFWPLQPLDWLAAVCQVAAVILIVNVIGNLTSILAPIRVKTGGMESVQPKISAIFLQLILGTCVLVAVAPLALPAASGWILKSLNLQTVWPINLIASLALLMLAVLVYRWALPRQARLLHRRERDIMEIVANTVER